MFCTGVVTTVGAAPPLAADVDIVSEEPLSAVNLEAILGIRIPAHNFHIMR